MRGWTQRESDPGRDDPPMGERVVELDLGVTWSPGSPDAVLLASDLGPTFLMLRPHHDDRDRRWVVLRWEGVRLSVMQPPNDEAISGHRLFAKGLRGILWAAEVLESEWIADLERRNRMHPYHQPNRYRDLRHFLVLLKEDTVEVVAEAIQVVRIDASSSAEAIGSLTRP
jgi:hypothetical protein